MKWWLWWTGTEYIQASSTSGKCDKDGGGDDGNTADASLKCLNNAMC